MNTRTSWNRPGAAQGLAASVWAIVVAWWIYAPEDTAPDSEPLLILLYVLLAAAVGAVIGRWWALVLALVPVLLAIPSGLDDPPWYGFLYLEMPIAAAALGAGVALRRIGSSWRSAWRASGLPEHPSEPPA